MEEISFSFQPEPPKEFQANILNISGNMKGDSREYLFQYRHSVLEKVYVLEYESTYNLRSEASIDDSLIAVGHHGFIFLYDLVNQQNLLSFPLSGYFCHLYWHEGHLYVTDAGSVLCVDRKGKIIWHSKNLGIDGVILTSFDEEKIFGSGEWDPPGGWVDFVLDCKTGFPDRRD